MCCVHQYAGRHALAEIPRYLLLTIGLYWMPHHPTFIFFFDRELSFCSCDSIGAGFQDILCEIHRPVVTPSSPYYDPIHTPLLPHYHPMPRPQIGLHVD